MSHDPSPTGPTLDEPPLPVRTARLLLRPVAATDAPAMGYYRSAEVCRYLPFAPLDDDTLAERMARLVAGRAPSRPGESLNLAVVHDDAVVGDLMLRLTTRLRPDEPPGVAEIGWVFTPEVAGRGFATEAAGALVDLAFDHYPLHRLVAQLDPRNTASAQLCERIGMRREAHTRADYPSWQGSWADTVVYGLLRTDRS